MDLEKANKEYSMIEEKRKTIARALENKATEIRKSRVRGLVVRQEAIEQELKDSFRVTDVTRHVIAMRKRALKHVGIRSILERHGTPVEEVALVERFPEKWNFTPSGLYCNNPHLRTIYTESTWTAHTRYHYGGPKDPIQIIFEGGKGLGYQIIGVLLTRGAFPKGGVFSLFAKGGRRRQLDQTK